eukprot:scaffold37703_cov75-Cyclotella_meneghiniana.AAC.1
MLDPISKISRDGPHGMRWGSRLDLVSKSRSSPTSTTYSGLPSSVPGGTIPSSLDWKGGTAQGLPSATRGYARSTKGQRQRHNTTNWSGMAGHNTSGQPKGV